MSEETSININSRIDERLDDIQLFLESEFASLIVKTPCRKETILEALNNIRRLIYE